MASEELRLRDGRYVVRGILGEGSQGTTYDAVDVQDGRAVAIKRFDVRGARSWKDVELAEREIRVLSSLDHPLVPRYIDHFEQDGALYMVMEQVEGETLDAIVRREGRLSEDEVRRFLACADRALTYLHGRSSPVIHRDIKPRNVIRRPDGSYVLVDFGTVSELLLRRGSSTIAGTIGYMAPEQLQGRAMPATDVYAVGATALRALTGVEPETLPHRGLGVDVRAALRGFAGPVMTAAIGQMLEPDPDRRPASLANVLDGVRAHAASAPPPAPAPAPEVGKGVAAPLPFDRTFDRKREDAAVKSLRRLLWVLWGLGWVIVPVVTDQLGVTHLIPSVMFGWLALIFIVSWHKGAVLRAAIRGLMGSNQAALPPEESVSRRRVEVVASDKQQVRVHTSDLGPEEQVGHTEVQSEDEERRRRAGTR